MRRRACIATRAVRSDHRDNRWRRGPVIDALYLTGDEPGAWAEWYRHLAEASLPPTAGLPRDLWTLRIASIPVADLADEDRLDRVGLPLPSPGRRTWPAFQDVGEQLHAEGWAGLIAPSAARSASLVLCLFLPLPNDAVSPGATCRAR